MTGQRLTRDTLVGRTIVLWRDGRRVTIVKDLLTLDGDIPFVRASNEHDYYVSVNDAGVWDEEDNHVGRIEE